MDGRTSDVRKEWPVCSFVADETIRIGRVANFIGARIFIRLRRATSSKFFKPGHSRLLQQLFQWWNRIKARQMNCSVGEDH